MIGKHQLDLDLSKDEVAVPRPFSTASPVNRPRNSPENSRSKKVKKDVVKLSAFAIVRQEMHRFGAGVNCFYPASNA